VSYLKLVANQVGRRTAALTMNILRLMGQSGLLWPTDAPMRHLAKRRRIKTVTHELIYRAGRLIEHGRRMVLGFGRQRPRSHSVHAPACAAGCGAVKSQAGRQPTPRGWFIQYLRFTEGPVGRIKPCLHAVRTATS